MSTVASSFVQDRASGTNLPTLSLIGGAAKAWGYGNNTVATPVLNLSLNISSLTDQSVGQLRYNLTSGFAGIIAAVGGSASALHIITAPVTSSQVEADSYNAAHTLADASSVIVCYGPLP